MSQRQLTDIPKKVREIVLLRDSIDGRPCCIYCGNPYGIQLAHVIGRAQGGKGVPENLVCLCWKCHQLADNGFGPESEEIRNVMRGYVRRLYPSWNEKAYTVGLEDKWN